MTLFSQVLVVTGLLAAGVVYGTDMFFAVVGRPALEETDEQSLTDVMGHLHKYGDVRMPIFGALGAVSALGLMFTAGLSTPAGKCALLGLAGMVTQLALYLRVGQPVNRVLTAAALQHRPAPDPRALQRRWDSVIGLRALGLTVAMAGLALAALSLK